MEWVELEIDGDVRLVKKPEEIERIELSNGKIIVMDEMYFHSPWFHKQIKSTTMRSVLKWWCENRGSFVGSVFAPEYTRMLELYFDYIPEFKFFTDTFEDLEVTLRVRSLLRHPAINYEYYSSASTNTPFQLCETEEGEPEPPKYKLDFSYCARVTVRPVTSPNRVAETKWNKRYNYSYKMEPEDFKFFRRVKHEDKVYFGMELELSTKLSYKELQHIVTDIEPKQEPFFIMKDDGSVNGKYSNRVELVTVPCSPRYLRKEWKTFFQKVEHLCSLRGKTVGDYFDINTDLNNGIHIHVSKDSFRMKSHVHRFMTAFHQWDKDSVSLFNAISNRPTDYTDHGYCHINYQYKETKSKASFVKFQRRVNQRSIARRLKGIVADRHSICHNGSGNCSPTVEVRLYQGIFDLSHIFRCISFTEAMFEFAHCIGYSQFDENFTKAFNNYVRQDRKYSSLYEVFDKCVS